MSVSTFLKIQIKPAYIGGITHVNAQTSFFHAVHEFGNGVIVIVNVRSAHCPVYAADDKFDTWPSLTGGEINVLEHDGKYELPVRVRCVELHDREGERNYIAQLACKHGCPLAAYVLHSHSI